MNGKVQMVSFIGEEGRNSSSSTQSVIVSKFCHRKEFGPVVLLIITVDLEVLF
jgi:hypothetical protein